MHATVHDWEHGLLYVDGRFRAVLPSGRHRLGWPLLGRRREVFRLRRGPQLLSSAPADVISADRLLYRLAAAVLFEIVDPRTAFEQNYDEKLRAAVGAALVRLASGRSLEALIGDRAEADGALTAMLPEPVAGCRVQQAALSNVTLPPELRRLYAEAERARLEGTAALERARGEQAALRALNNAARLLKGNPELMNLRLLQAMAGGGGKAQPTLVLGAAAGVQPVRPEPDGGLPTPFTDTQASSD